MSWGDQPTTTLAEASAPPPPEEGVFTPKRYALSEGVYWGSPETTDSLAHGFYQPWSLPGGRPALKFVKTKSDSLLRLPDPTCDMLLAEFVDFWAKAAQMTARGLACKRGLLLWGPPGSGKTSALQIMCQHMIKEMSGIVVLASEPSATAASLQMFRAIEPERPVIVVYEDIDALVSCYGEPGYLALLDGELQISGIVNVATTNYPEHLDRRFKDRPGRFDRVTLVGMPLPEARRAYFAAKAPEIDEAVREGWVEASDGWSIAHLRELVVAHLILGEGAEAVIARLNEMRQAKPSSEQAKIHDIGFLNRKSAAAGRPGHIRF